MQTSRTYNKIIILNEIYCGYLGHGGFATVEKLSRRQADLGRIIELSGKLLRSGRTLDVLEFREDHGAAHAWRYNRWITD